jgi:hypothetical protein
MDRTTIVVKGAGHVGRAGPGGKPWLACGLREEEASRPAFPTEGGGKLWEAGSAAYPGSDSGRVRGSWPGRLAALVFLKAPAA